MSSAAEKGACEEADQAKEKTIQRLLGSFEEHTAPYLRYLSFPEKLVRTQWRNKAEELKQEEGEKG
jgi:hypothetical protein